MAKSKERDRDRDREERARKRAWEEEERIRQEEKRASEKERARREREKVREKEEQRLRERNERRKEAWKSDSFFDFLFIDRLAPAPSSHKPPPKPPHESSDRSSHKHSDRSSHKHSDRPSHRSSRRDSDAPPEIHERGSSPSFHPTHDRTGSERHPLNHPLPVAHPSAPPQFGQQNPLAAAHNPHQVPPAQYHHPSPSVNSPMMNNVHPNAPAGAHNLPTSAQNSQPSPAAVSQTMNHGRPNPTGATQNPPQAPPVQYHQSDQAADPSFMSNAGQHPPQAQHHHPRQAVNPLMTSHGGPKPTAGTQHQPQAPPPQDYQPSPAVSLPMMNNGGPNPQAMAHNTPIYAPIHAHQPPSGQAAGTAMAANAFTNAPTPTPNAPHMNQPYPPKPVPDMAAGSDPVRNHHHDPRGSALTHVRGPAPNTHKDNEPEGIYTDQAIPGGLRMSVSRVPRAYPPKDAPPYTAIPRPTSVDVPEEEYENLYTGGHYPDYDQRHTGGRRAGGRSRGRHNERGNRSHNNGNGEYDSQPIYEEGTSEDEDDAEPRTTGRKKLLKDRGDEPRRQKAIEYPDRDL